MAPSDSEADVLYRVEQSEAFEDYQVLVPEFDPDEIPDTHRRMYERLREDKGTPTGLLCYGFLEGQFEVGERVDHRGIRDAMVEGAKNSDDDIARYYAEVVDGGG